MKEEPYGVWYFIGVALNWFHLVLSIVLVFGGWFMPIQYVPIIVISNLLLLYRYHDYCFVSEITQLVKNKSRGCEAEFKFSEDAQAVYKDYLGIEVTTHAIGAFATLFFMISAVIGLARLSVKYKFDIFPTRNAVIFGIGFMTLWILVEIYMAFFYQPMPQCPK